MVLFVFHSVSRSFVEPEHRMLEHMWLATSNWPCHHRASVDANPRNKVTLFFCLNKFILPVLLHQKLYSLILEAEEGHFKNMNALNGVHPIKWVEWFSLLDCKTGYVMLFLYHTYDSNMLCCCLLSFACFCFLFLIPTRLTPPLCKCYN